MQLRPLFLAPVPTMSMSLETNRATTVSRPCMPRFSTATGIKGRAIAAASPASAAGAVASMAVTTAAAAALAAEAAIQDCSQQFTLVVLAVAAAGAPATIA
jgi:hypothetical protein